MILQQQQGPPQEKVEAGQTLSDYLLQIVLALLWMEVPEHGKHLSQYFSLFVMYASLGIPEKTQLLKLNVPATFINVALDEGPGPPIKYQYSTELGKLYQVVSQLVRCCDIASKGQSSMQGKAPLPNPYLESSCAQANGPLMPIQPTVYELIFKRYVVVGTHSACSKIYKRVQKKIKIREITFHKSFFAKKCNLTGQCTVCLKG